MTTPNTNRIPLDQIIDGFTLGPFATNCYIVRDPASSECWIIDAGWGAEAMIQRIQDEQLEPSRLILTHAHPDHIAGVPAFREAFPGVPVAIHAAEKDWLSDPTKNLSSALGDDPVVMDPPDETLEDEQALGLGETRWHVLHTPGHSPGGVTLHCPDLAVAFAGDTLFAGSIGRYDFPSSDGPTLFASIRHRLYTLPDDTAVLPGHGPATTVAREKKSNPFVRPEG